MKKTHLKFEEVEQKPKTKGFKVLSEFDGATLGYIGWYGRWRAYVLTPNDDRVWSWDCLKECSDFIKQLMDARKRQAK